MLYRANRDALLIIDIAASLNALKLTTSVAKDAGRIYFTAQVIELQQTLLDLLAQNSELTSKVAALEKRVRDQEDMLLTSPRKSTPRCLPHRGAYPWTAYRRRGLDAVACNESASAVKQIAVVVLSGRDNREVLLQPALGCGS